MDDVAWWIHDVAVGVAHVAGQATDVAAWPVRFTMDWDIALASITVLFALGFVACVAACLCAPHHRMAKIATTGVVAAVLAVVLTRWTETLCFSHVEHPDWTQSTPHWSDAAVPELQSDGLALIESLKTRGLPAVFRGVISDTTPVRLSDWTPDALRIRVAGQSDGHTTPQLEVQVGNVEQEATQLYDLDLAELLSGMEDTEWVESHRTAEGRVPYVAESDDLFEQHPWLMMEAQRLTSSLKLHDSRFLLYQHLIWIGPAGSITGLHSDIDPLNVLIQMYGTKTLWLFPPDHAGEVYPSRKYDYGAVLSDVNPFDVDGGKFPKYNATAALAVTMRAGDALFVPAGWFHYAAADSAVISVSVRLLTVCESVSLGPWIFREWAHRLGWYTPGNGCVCHDSDGDYDVPSY